MEQPIDASIAEKLQTAADDAVAIEMSYEALSELLGCTVRTVDINKSRDTIQIRAIADRTELEDRESFQAYYGESFAIFADEIPSLIWDYIQRKRTK
jgi:hypothetical protein